MKLKTSIFLLLFGLMTATAFAQSAKDIETIRALEAARVEAILKKDFNAMEKFFADDMTYGHSTGVTESKKVFIDHLRPTGDRTYTAIDRSDVNTRFYKNTALITGRAALKLIINGNPVDAGTVQFLAVWIRDKGKWRFEAWQSTRIP